MFHKSFALAAVLATALAPAAFAGGWGSGWLDDGIDKESVKGTLDGEIFSGNVAVAEGDHTIAATMNLKEEFGSIKGVQDINGPDSMRVEGSLMTYGTGLAAGLSMDSHGNGARAQSGVLGQMDGKLELKTIERND